MKGSTLNILYADVVCTIVTLANGSIWWPGLIYSPGQLSALLGPHFIVRETTNTS